MGYTKDAIKGISWVGLLRITTRFLAFVRIAILARILTPSQFGLFGIASLVLALIEIITETGINVFLIQENRKVESYISTAWIVSIVRGIFVALLLFVLSPIIASFFNAPEALQLLMLISLVPLVRGFINPSIALLQKDLLFDKEFFLRFFIFFIDATIAVLVTFLTLSPVGIIWGLIVGAIAEVYLSFVMISPRPQFRFELPKVIEVIHRGKWITASGIFNYLFHNIDDIIVGKILGTSALGLYQVGYRISTLPISEVADVISRVTFPVYVKIINDKKRLARAFFKTTSLVTLLTIPFGVVLFLFPEIIVRILLGEQWVQAALTIKILALFGVTRAISGSASALYLAAKKQVYVTVVTCVSLAVLLFSIFLLIHLYGIVGAAMSVLIGSIAPVPLFIYYTRKVLHAKNETS